MSEEVVMQLIVHAGNARSASMVAIRHAREGRFEEARAALQEAGEELARAHQVQTDLIQREAAGERVAVSLLMVHAQDHLMNALTVRDLAAELVGLYERLAAGGGCG